MKKSDKYIDRIVEARRVCKDIRDKTAEARQASAKHEREVFDKKVEQALESIVLLIENGVKTGQTLYKFSTFSPSDYDRKNIKCCWEEGEFYCDAIWYSVLGKVVEQLENFQRLGLKAQPKCRVYADRDYGGLVTDYWLEVII